MLLSCRQRKESFKASSDKKKRKKVTGKYFSYHPQASTEKTDREKKKENN